MADRKSSGENWFKYLTKALKSCAQGNKRLAKHSSSNQNYRYHNLSKCVLWLQRTLLLKLQTWMSKSGSVLPKASARSIIHNFISKQEKCGEKYRNFQSRSLLLHVDNNLLHLLRALIGSLDCLGPLWLAKDITLVLVLRHAMWNFPNDFLTCNSPILDRFSNGKGSPCVWLEKVNWGSTGKAVGTCERQDHTRHTSTHIQTVK